MKNKRYPKLNWEQRATIAACLESLSGDCPEEWEQYYLDLADYVQGKIRKFPKYPEVEE